MMVAGLDIGARYVKLVFVDENKKIKGLKKSLAGYDINTTVNNMFCELCAELNTNEVEIKQRVLTGAGKGAVDLINISGEVTESVAAAKGVTVLYPEVRTIIEVGAEESKAIRVDKDGFIEEIVVNEKCAAGSGSFAETMARALEMSIEEFAEKSLESDKRISMNAQCTVFAESEVVSLIHSGTDKRDIAKAVLNAIASRVASMARKVKIEPEVILIGGMARNAGFVSSLKNILEVDNLIIPENPEFMNAVGAAFVALEKL